MQQRLRARRSCSSRVALPHLTLVAVCIITHPFHDQRRVLIPHAGTLHLESDHRLACNQLVAPNSTPHHCVGGRYAAEVNTWQSEACGRQTPGGVAQAFIAAYFLAGCVFRIIPDWVVGGKAKFADFAGCGLVMLEAPDYILF